MSWTGDPVELVNLLNHVKFPGVVGGSGDRVVFVRVYKSKLV